MPFFYSGTVEPESPPSMIILNPEHSQIESVGAESPVVREHLTQAWIRQRFTDAPAWQPEISDEQREALSVGDFRDAAVLIVLVQREAGLSVLFTRRSAHLTHHAGQISFPGGRTEAHDDGPVATALRETCEEIGLSPGQVEIIGQLPTYHTITGYRVTPVLGLVAELPLLTPERNEVEEVFEVPLVFLMDAATHQRRSLVVSGPDEPESRRFFYAMPYQNYFIWGATAGMLRNLFHFLRV